MGNSVLEQFTSSIGELVSNRNGGQLQDYLQLEPPLPPIYSQMINELRQRYPSGPRGDAELLKLCESILPNAKGAISWSAFPPFMKLYFSFLRDVNTDNLLETYNLLKALLNQCIVALGDSQMGVVVLPTVLYLSKVLAKLAMGLDRRPDLVAHLLREQSGASKEEAAEKVTLVEQAANVVREAFIKCLTDRSAAPGSKPEGKRLGIYLMANLCLKLLFKCGKLRNAEQMFVSINTHSPPLEFFPASQRVTYLYYLGRYLFSNNLFYPARNALQGAYDQCHHQALAQKHLILTYLIPCNIILGRFPSATLLQRPEARGLGEKFVPLCRIIVSGDYVAFRQFLAVDSSTSEWFARKGILLQLRNRCEILTWRSLTRKVFIYGGFQSDPNSQAQRGPPPFLYLSKLDAATRWLQNRHSPSQHFGSMLNGVGSAKDSLAAQSKFGSDTVYLPPDIDFAGLGSTQSGPDIDSNVEDYIAPDGYFDAQGHWNDNASRSLVNGDPDLEYSTRLDELHPYAHHSDTNVNGSSTLMQELESTLASLLAQGLIRGYLTHKNPRFAIPGARVRGALPTGFPNVAQTIEHKEREEGEEVPGWVRSRSVSSKSQAPFGGSPFTAAAGGGRVVNLSGAKPVGVQ